MRERNFILTLMIEEDPDNSYEVDGVEWTSYEGEGPNEISATELRNLGRENCKGFPDDIDILDWYEVT